MYYGNPNAQSASDGDATFLFFDDFLGTSLDLDKWVVVQETYTVVADGYLKINYGQPDPSHTVIASRTFTIDNGEVRVRWIRKHTYNDIFVYFRYQDIDNTYHTYVSSVSGYQYHRIYKRVGGTSTLISDSVSSTQPQTHLTQR
jgi:Domain of unknown function (DUF2341).